MEKNGEIKQKGHFYQMGHNPFRSFYAGIASTMIIYIHTLPLKSLHLLSLHLQSLPLQTLRLVFFWPVWLFKHKEYLPQRAAK
jgi:hypothetical protein